MPDSSPTFLILDGNALLHRAWHALPPLTTKDGLVVNAAYGFALVVEKMREQFHPDFMAVAWDLPGKTFRHEKYDAYKATRVKKEQELYDQIPIIRELLEAFAIPSYDAAGYEADDVIGTLAKKAESEEYQTLIVTGDLDALQLVSDKTQVVFFQKGISETKRYDEAAVRERFGLSPAALVDYKALRGDASDNIPGVFGIGERTATVLVHTYGSVENIFQALSDGKIEEKVAKKLRGQEDQARASRELVEIVRDVNVPFAFAQAKTREPDWEKVLDQYRKLEFRTLIRKHEHALSKRASATSSHAEMSSSRQGGPRPDSRIQVVRDEQELKRIAFAGEEIALLVAEQQPDLFGATLAALAVSDGKTTVVVPNPAQKHITVIAAGLSARTGHLVTHDLKKLMHQLGSSFASSPHSPFGLGRADRMAFDTMIASYLLHSGSRLHDLPSVVSGALAVKLSELPEAYASQKDYERLGQAAALLPRLKAALEKQLDASGLREVYEQIELPLVPVLYKMEKAGVLIDTGALETFSRKLKKRILALEKQIRAIGGKELNVNSPIQLAEVLFDLLKLPTKGIKKTKTGYSTAASELDKLWDAHEIIPLISQHREFSKLQSTYVETLPKLADAQGRVHTTFNQTVTATGRLSSSDPNLQNIPIKTELGREIRKAFVAPRGKRLVAADYSQIELRLAAVIAKDQPFIQAFKDGADIHTRTAAEVWGVDEHAVTKDQRRAAKAINFGILYGMGPRSLSRSTGLSFTDAKVFIEKYFEIHYAIRDYLDATKLKAHADGYVETLFGRRRSLPEIHSGIPLMVAQAERMAINMPIQGTAADLMKKAMLAVDGWLTQSGLPAVLFLQVHDELVLEAEKDAAGAVASGVKEMMEGVASLDVPLVVDVQVGANWGDLT
ncbi:DNA polymerase I [Candidatus Parcubacteria bacterium]|nr:DNA polymerase I [Candidatus Parcubacteria bacterium]